MAPPPPRHDTTLGSFWGRWLGGTKRGAGVDGSHDRN
jgi:hypothetical protein